MHGRPIGMNNERADGFIPGFVALQMSKLLNVTHFFPLTLTHTDPDENVINACDLLDSHVVRSYNKLVAFDYKVNHWHVANESIKTDVDTPYKCHFANCHYYITACHSNGL